ncbi:MAG: TRAP transporter substrate-binding protein [Oscillospiraceae bacterium]|nr:TRAP transporter substrate-binding protein [Oscillospiraceae bacterium]
MKKMLSLFVGTSLLLSLLTACGSEGSGTSDNSSSSGSGNAESIVLKLGHNSNAESMYNQGCEKFAELVNEYTNGSVTIEIHTSGTLGDEAELLDGVRMGTVDMALINSSQLATYCSEFSVLSLPFLFEDYDHVEAVVNNEEICDILTTDALENGNVQLLMPFWADGFRHFVNAKHEVVSPSDMAGLKLRVPAWEALVAATEEFGAAALTMPFGEAYSGVSSGTVDGMEGTSWSLLANGLEDVCSYLTLTGHVYSPSVLIMNVDAYNNRLSDEQVEALTQAAAEAGAWETNLVEESEQSDLEELAAAGMTITEVDKSAWEEAAQPVYEMFANTYDQNLISLIQGLK